jgi:hypothetical protein
LKRVPAPFVTGRYSTRRQNGSRGAIEIDDPRILVDDEGGGRDRLEDLGDQRFPPGIFLAHVRTSMKQTVFPSVYSPHDVMQSEIHAHVGF